jgi:hypothetical protein
LMTAPGEGDSFAVDMTLTRAALPGMQFHEG